MSLFNILEERDVQIRGYRIRLPLDMLLVATANPDDYTHRGRIVSPLKDGSARRSVRTTPRPRARRSASWIKKRPDRWAGAGARPIFMKEVVAALTAELRRSRT